MSPSPRDRALIDALEARPIEPFTGKAWRVVKEGRDPCVCSSAGNRWDDGTFDVLYTSLERDGALAEMYFHLKAGQPVFPSKLRYTLHELSVEIDSVLDLKTQADLAAVGYDTAQYGKLAYKDRKGEYPRTQEIGEAVNFLGSSEPGDAAGILVPSARWDCANLVVLCRHAGPAAIEEVTNHGVIDWTAWAAQHSNER